MDDPRQILQIPDLSCGMQMYSSMWVPSAGGGEEQSISDNLTSCKIEQASEERDQRGGSLGSSFDALGQLAQPGVVRGEVRDFMWREVRPS